MGSIQELIELVKVNHGFNDKQIAEKLGVSEHSVLSWRSGRRRPRRDKELLLTEMSKKEERANMNQLSYIIDLQKEKIDYQQNKIMLLESELKKEKIDTSNPLWNDIDFDFMTTQKYEDDNFKFFKSYNMVRYEDFYNALGYTKAEAKELWKIQHDWFTGKGREDVDGKYAEEKYLGFKLNAKKTDNYITDDAKTELHFQYNLKHQIVSQLQIYNACYIKKNGDELMAIVSVLYNFPNRSSQSKVKFIRND